MSVDPRCYLLGALMILTIPLPWLAAAFTAALMHELFHIAAIVLCRGEVKGIHIGPSGAVIHTGPLTRKQELLCALAGPAGSLLLLLLCRRLPRLALCGAVQGGFNLLPFYPLDGGRAVRSCCQLLFPSIGGFVEVCLEGAVLVAFLFLTVWYRSMVLFLLWCCLVCRMIQRKKPCKERLFGVQ